MNRLTVFTAATDGTKMRLRPHVSRLRLQLVAESAARLRQNPLRGFSNRAGVGHGRKRKKTENDKGRVV